MLPTRKNSVIGWVRPSASLPAFISTPARAATSASAEQSTITDASITSSPDLLAITTPVARSPSLRVCTTIEWNSSSTPASRHISVPTVFTPSASNGVTLSCPKTMKLV